MTTDLALTLWDSRGCCGGRPWATGDVTLKDVDLNRSVADVKREILTKYYINSPSQASLRAPLLRALPEISHFATWMTQPLPCPGPCRNLSDFLRNHILKHFFLIFFGLLIPVSSLAPHLPSADPSRKIAPDHPAAHSRFMAGGALQKDNVLLKDIFPPGGPAHRVFFAITNSLPWNESGQEIPEDDSCPVDKPSC